MLKMLLLNMEISMRLFLISYLLQGEAIIGFEEREDVHLKAGDYLNIPLHVKHQVKWTRPNSETIWLAIHY